MKFIVSKDFFEKVPNAIFGIIIAKNIDNTKNYPEITAMLAKEIENISNKYENQKAKEIPEIVLYRNAFQNININPNKYMCSIEALISRTLKSHFIPNINPLVDLGNALSVKYLIPIGIHDLKNVNNDIELRKANDNDYFIPFGESEKETPDIDEYIYVSGNEVRTRRWTWRQGENAKVSENIKEAFIPLDGFEENKEALLKLQDEFKSVLEKYGATCVTGIITKENNIFEF